VPDSLRGWLRRVAGATLVDWPLAIVSGLLVFWRAWPQLAPVAGVDGYGLRWLFALAGAGFAGILATALVSYWFGLHDEDEDPDAGTWRRRVLVLVLILLLWFGWPANPLVHEIAG
jgi:hypothetical protein